MPTTTTGIETKPFYGVDSIGELEAAIALKGRKMARVTPAAVRPFCDALGGAQVLGLNQKGVVRAWAGSSATEQDPLFEGRAAVTVALEK